MLTKTITLRQWNITMLFVLLATIFVFLVKQSPEILDVDCIQTCGSFKKTGVLCATCGITRSVYAFFYFRFNESLQFNPIGFYIAILIIFELMVRLYFIATKKYYRNYYKVQIFALLSVFFLITVYWHYLN
jgi:hypothetical protein